MLWKEYVLFLCSPTMESEDDMRRKAAWIVWSVSVLIIGIFLIQELELHRIPVEYTSMVMGIPVVEKWDFLENKEKRILQESPEIFFEGTLIPYSVNENTLYVSQSNLEEAWKGRFSVKQEKAFLCMPEDSLWEQKEEAIEEGHPFTLWLVTEDVYYEMALVVSGMPVMSIQTRSSEVQNYEDADRDTQYFGSEILYYGELRLFDPGAEHRAYQITECDVEYHEKGSSSSNFDKKPYSISLKDSAGENLNVSLLGMRQDDSWKLNAMVMDDNRIREKTATEIWEAFDRASIVDEPGPRMEYVELILDNDYKGLYCLVEPVDAKKLKLDSNDVMYKIIGWALPEDEYMQEAVDSRHRFMQSIRLRYPKVIEDYNAAWYPMRDYLNLFYHDEGAREDAPTHLNMENALDSLFFNMVVSGSDNYFKNLYLVAEVTGDGMYQMKHIPWDLDLTFEIVYFGEGRNNVRIDKDVTHIYAMEWFHVMLEHHPDVIRELMPDQWRRYREGFLKTEVIQCMFIENRDYLLGTGVVKRENDRWPDYQMNVMIDELLEFQEQRMEWLDLYFTELYEEEWTLEMISNTAMR